MKTISVCLMFWAASAAIGGCSITGGDNLCDPQQGVTDGGGGDGGGGAGGGAASCSSDAECSDGDACTADACLLGVCTHVQTCACPADCEPAGDAAAQKGECDHGNPNTLDRCASVDLCPRGACSHAGVRCDWLDPPAIQAALCDDGAGCTLDYCEKDRWGPDLGVCRHEPIPDCAP